MADIKEIRFFAGLGLGGVGTCLAVYLIPNALSAYHWAILVTAFLTACGFASFLFFSDYDQPESIRLRFFLRYYLTAVAITFLAPVALADLAPVVSESRFLKILPLFSLFVAMVAAFAKSSNVSTVLLRRK